MSSALGNGNSGTKVIAAIAVTSGIAIVLVLLTVFVYLRGGALRGLAAHSYAFVRPHIWSRFFSAGKRGGNSGHGFVKVEDGEKGQPGNESQGALRREGSRSEEMGYMARDNGEWLEEWRRGKERMSEILGQPQPKLYFNPALPLPPIVLEDGRVVSVRRREQEKEGYQTRRPEVRFDLDSLSAPNRVEDRRASHASEDDSEGDE